MALILAVVALWIGSTPLAIAASGPSRLTVTVSSAPGMSDTWTLTCDPVGGTHPNRVRACALLESLKKPFAPLPKGLACTMVYGGPERARVVGRWQGSAVNAGFARTNGCETARWTQYEALLTAGGAVAVRGRVDLGPTCPVQRPGEVCEIAGAPATATATSGSRRRTAQADSDGFLLRLPRAVWIVTADAGMYCTPVRVDTRNGPSPSLVVVSCDTGIR